MKRSIIKLLMSLGLMASLVFAISLSTKGGGWSSALVVLLILLAFPIFIMSWFDFTKELRDLNSHNIILKLFLFFFGVPQALFGLLSIAIGLSLIAWVVYNSLIEIQPQYTGGFLAFGFGPGMVLLGYILVRGAFATNRKLDA
jgi:hypothetical protein